MEKGRKNLRVCVLDLSPFMSHESVSVSTLIYSTPLNFDDYVMCTPPSTDNGPSPTHGEETLGVLQGSEFGVERR